MMSEKRGRKKVGRRGVTMNVIMPESLLQDLDSIKEELRAVSRSEAIRWLIYEKYRI
jgi:metal-responsive CopG/Arc/MetJ family transcriptional regulator